MPDKEFQKLIFRWKKKTGQYQQGESLYINKIRVGGWGWNSARSRLEADDSTRWIGYVDLPSSKEQRVYGANTDEVKAKIEQTVIAWFIEALGGVGKG